MKKLLPVLLLVIACNTESKQNSAIQSKEDAERSVLKAAAPGMAKAKLDVDKMQSYFDLAKKELMSTDEVLNYWNRGMGKVIGEAKNINQAEELFKAKKEDYLKFMNAKAQAAAAFALSQKAIEDSIKNAAK